MTEREIVLRERQAFADGAVCWVGECRHRTNSYPPGSSIRLEEITASAVRKFPLPKITRPRVLKDSAGTEWRMVGERLEFRSVDNWHPYLGGAAGYDIGDGFYGTCLRPTPDRIKIWAGLLANPTEEVEDV